MPIDESTGASANGWPTNQNPAVIGIDVAFSAAGSTPSKDGGFSGGVKGGDVATVFRYLVERLHREVEPMESRAGRLGHDCWGYLYRSVAGNPGVLSAHASGTAVDYNVWLHPDHTVAGSAASGWTAMQVAAIEAILDEVGVVTWWSTSSPAHFEIVGSVQRVADAARRLSAFPIDPESGPDAPEVEDDADWMYDTFVVDSGPEVGTVWIAWPGVFEAVPNQEYYDVLIGHGIAREPRVVIQRELDVLRDAYRRLPRIVP